MPWHTSTVDGLRVDLPYSLKLFQPLYEMQPTASDGTFVTSVNSHRSLLQ